jgi:hypothetical protein
VIVDVIVLVDGDRDCNGDEKEFTERSEAQKEKREGEFTRR